MRRRRTSDWWSRLCALVAAGASVLVGGVAWFATITEDRAEVVGPAGPGWQTIRLGEVQVDVPATWERSDSSGCEFRSERWAPPGAPECGEGAGLAFYASATFDPATGPGVHRTDDPGAPAWGGYAYGGDLAVYVADTDRDLVARVLGSVD